MAADGSNPALAVLVVASCDDNHLRLQLSENVQVGRLAICRQAKTDKVRLQIGLPIEEFFLAPTVQVGEEEDFQPVKLAKKHQRSAIGRAWAVQGAWMENLPAADSILGGSLVNGNSVGAELLNETAIKRRSKVQRTNDGLGGRFLLEELRKGFQMLFVAVSQKVVAIAGARRLIAQERLQNERGTPLRPAVDEPIVLNAGGVNANRVASGNGKNCNGCALFAGDNLTPNDS